MSLESKIEEKFVRWCENQGWECLKLRIDGQKGFPDRTILRPSGLVTFCELKRPGGTTSAQQDEWLRKLQALGFGAGCFDNLSDLQDFLGSDLL